VRGFIIGLVVGVLLGISASQVLFPDGLGSGFNQFVEGIRKHIPVNR
jgi:hypothetical protein